ncbi:hypothetical protein FHU33_4212 [Blastococcus colisei]|uniref:Phosphotransferase family enzyme n=1 Tax=Blastococcus colisei TaxID=1564162 RepID=A0A543P0C5_9ACTN|nr:hypothetical protein [Blastococcus colisei]TQN37557.1 hypothetical protein FHU33_4212 [Blastococcus colisei]
MTPASNATTEQPRTDAALRLEYLHEVARLLWPAPASVWTGRAGEPAPAGMAGDFVVVPSLDRPRLLVPLGSARAAATAVRRYSEPGSLPARLRLDALALAMRAGLGPAVMRDRLRVGTATPDSVASDSMPPPDTIETHLAEALGRPVRVSLHVGPARANRKPVLQLLSDAGEVLGFAKVGINDLTRRLVVDEARSLTELAAADFTRIEVPRVLHHGTWRGLEVLAQSPLPIWQKRVPLSPAGLGAAMLEVAQVCGTGEEPLTTSRFWTGLDGALDGLADDDTVTQLRAAFASLTAAAAGTVVPLGAWHGDWTPWNCASVRGRVLVWDWERFEHGVPLGFDALHFHLQRAVVGRRADARLAVAGCLSDAPALLAPFGIGRDEAAVVALSYLVALATRYLQDGQAEAGARLGVLGRWLLPELVGRVSQL